MDERSFPTDFAIEAIRGAPPVAVATAAVVGMSMNDWVIVMTMVYVAMQIAWLTWKFVDKARGVKVSDDG